MAANINETYAQNTMNSNQTKLRHIACLVRRTDDGKGVERVYPSYSGQSINDIIKWSVYECEQQSGNWLNIFITN